MRFNDEKALTAINYYKAATTTTTSRSLNGDDLFDDDFGVGDYVEFIGTGNAYERDLFFTISTAIAATSYTGHWEYKYRDGAYVNATVVDGTSDFSLTGDKNVTWNVKDVYFFSQLHIRYIIDTVDTPTEGGAFTKAKTGDNTIYIENGDTVTFQLIQAENDTNGWNAMERVHSAGIVDRLDHYLIYAQLEIESGGTISDNTYGSAIFNVWGGNDVACLFTNAVGGTLTLGSLDAGGNGYNGFDITTTFGVGHANARMAFQNYGDLNLYGSRIYSEANDISGTMDGRDCQLARVNSFSPTLDSTSDNLVILDTSRGWLEFAAAGKTYYGIKYHGFTRFGVHRASGIWYDCEWMSDDWYLLDDNNSGNVFTFVDCSPKPLYVDFRYTSQWFYWKHRVNVIVRDESGDLVNGATVVCKDVDGNTVFTKTTDATGMIDEQEVIETQIQGPAVRDQLYLGVDDDVRTPHTITATYGSKTGSVKIDLSASYGSTNPLAIRVEPPQKNGFYDSTLYDVTIN